MSNIKDWSTTATDNNDSPPDGFPEGQAPSTVNNSAREVMASVRTYYDEPEWREWGHTIAYASGTTFTTGAGDGDTTAIYHANRRIRAAGTLTTTIYGTISSSSHGAQTTVTVVWDSGSLQNESLAIALGFAADTVSIPDQAIEPDEIVRLASGTSIIFHQASAPTGWTQSVALNDYALRLVSGSGGGGGGTHGLSSPPSTAHTHTGPSHTHTGPSHTHTLNSHVHKWYEFETSANDESFGSAGGDLVMTQGEGNGTGTGLALLDSNGNNCLNLDLWTSPAIVDSGAGGTGNTGASGTGATGSSSPTAFAPFYADVISCSRD